MAKKGVFSVIATIAIVGVVVGVFSQTVLRDASVSTNTMTSEQAYADLNSKTKRIGVQEVSVNPQQLDVSEFLDAKDELPDIESSYPFVIAGNGDVNIEIFSSGEKAAETGSDSFLTSMAKKFNAQRNTTSDGKTMSVSLRSVPSGTAAEYISTGKYQPECYTPSNTLFGELVKNEGVELTVETDRLVGNVAGILVSKKTGDMLRADYGEASVNTVLNATIDGKMMMGYSNPYTSATGLNFLLSALASGGNDNIVDTAAVENFQKFQANVPLVSFTTQQMVQSADKGVVDGLVMEYQSYQNDPTLQRNYEFIPFGVRHDNPLYSIGNISAEKKEVIAAFVSFCAQNQAEATKDGFNGLDDYAYTGKVYDGNTIAQAQSVWKEEKDSGIPIVAEFVVDTSGSMRGEPINALKTAMINTIQYINDDNYIGIIGFDSDVREYLPIDQFSLTQKTLYKGAVNSLDANGNTATIDRKEANAEWKRKTDEEHKRNRERIEAQQKAGIKKAEVIKSIIVAGNDGSFDRLLTAAKDYFAAYDEVVQRVWEHPQCWLFHSTYADGSRTFDDMLTLFIKETGQITTVPWGSEQCNVLLSEAEEIKNINTLPSSTE